MSARSRYQPTVIAVACFLLIFGYICLYENEDIPGFGQEKKTVLAEFPLDNVVEATWQIGTESVSVKPAGMESGARLWSVTQPMATPADTSEVEGSLRTFEKLESERTVTETATDTSVFGFGATSPAVTLVASDGKKVTLALGGDINFSNSSYVKRDNTIFTINRYLGAAFKRSFKEIRSKQLGYGVKTRDATRVELTLPNRDIVLERNDKGQWWITKPVNIEADETEVGVLLDTVCHFRVDGYETDTADEKKLAECGLDKPMRQIKLSNAKGHMITLTTGHTRGNEVFMQVAGSKSIGVVSQVKVDYFDLTVDKLRNRKLPTLDRAQVQTVSVKTATATWKFARGATGSWTLDENGKKRDIDKEAVLALADAVNQVKITAFMADDTKTEHGLTAPDSNDEKAKASGTATVVEIGMASGSPRVIHLGAVEDQSQYLQIGGEREIYKVGLEFHNASGKLQGVVLAPPPASVLVGSAPTPAPVASLPVLSPSTGTGSGTESASGAGSGSPAAGATVVPVTGSVPVLGSMSLPLTPGAPGLVVPVGTGSGPGSASAGGSGSGSMTGSGSH